jgi:hypothetical protein
MHHFHFPEGDITLRFVRVISLDEGDKSWGRTDIHQRSTLQIPVSSIYHKVDDIDTHPRL